MVKRENGVVVDIEAPRPKRRRDSESKPEANAATAKTEDVDMADAGSSDHEGAGGGTDEVARSPEEVTELGLKVWHIVKNAVNKEGRSLSFDFLRLPSKRQYADYYIIIKKPIALDDIKANLDAHAYSSLEAVREDLEQCFKNAKKYNVRESQIWRDAKTLQKLANKEIDKIQHPDDENMDDGSDAEGGKKKKTKVPNLTRLMKNRLQKLIQKTGADGRVLSNVFMDLPSKKKWPMYYKIIKRPMCMEDIFKRIKRKEYTAIQDFMTDVDLVFANAMQFNEDHTPIWEDAQVLKQYFHQIMQDLPAPFNGQPLPEHSSTNKIVLKVPQPHNVTGEHPAASSGAPAASTAGASGSGTVMLRVPAAERSATANGATSTSTSEAKKAKVKSPALAKATIPASATPNAAAMASATSNSSAQHPVVSAPAPTRAQAQYMALNAQLGSALLPATPTGIASAATQAQISFPGNYAASTYYPSSSGSKIAPAATPTPTAAPLRVQPSSTSAMGGTSRAHSSTPAPSTVTAATTGVINTPSSATTVSSSSAAALSGPYLRSICLETQPLGRRLSLGFEEGVRSWMLRLSGAENKVVVSDVHFLGQNGDGDGEDGEFGDDADEGAKAGEDDAGDGKAEKREEEEEEEDMAQETVVTAPAPKKKRGRGRPPKAKPALPNGVDNKENNKTKDASSPVKGKPGRPPRRAMHLRSDSASGAAATEEVPPKPGRGAPPSVEDVRVKLNGVQISARAGAGQTSASDGAEDGAMGKTLSWEGTWDVEFGAGSHVLELGQRGANAVWKVYVERRI